jgi:hypothetical protein
VKVLFDQNAPRPLSRYLTEHSVTRAVELGWEELANGELIRSAEAVGFQVLVTADKNLRYQQNLENRQLAIVVLPAGRWPLVRPFVRQIAEAIDAAKPGSYIEVGG